MKMKVKESGSVILSAATSKNTVLRASNNQTLAEFTVKPVDGEAGLTLDDLSISLSGAKIADIEVLIDGSEEDPDGTPAANATGATYKPSLDLPAEGIVVKVDLTKKLTGAVELSVTSVNGKTQSRKFSKSYAEALVYIEKQENRGDETVFTLAVDADSDTTVKNVKLYANGQPLTGATYATEFSAGHELRTTNGSTAVYVDQISYEYVLGDTAT